MPDTRHREVARSSEDPRRPVEQAVERWLAEIRRQQSRRDRHRALLDEYWEHLTDESRDAMQRAMDELYDENGLPA